MQHAVANRKRRKVELVCRHLRRLLVDETHACGRDATTHAFEADGAAREAWYTQVGVEGDYGGVR
eukprot:CAMPEP_0181221928 /NCGR_PEP_ID=MMETSP1096-20121128/29676_1 /TAXON_ID=156174 ORGANISM="Chrysochromulina ericina, Strain CCMP281" /NCGR_SAMPLE_ID=MMETSP1096 /ASSEMBLY_ACC=CAM_ASM_000453 /LENGTH=64 /DNA_ID=CAMNT_0023314619 /DNA_START=874 /DNA_END=1064 /DNA_ORIENTATION=-